MRAVVLILALTLGLAAGVQAAGLALADLEPAKGDKGVYRVAEETTMALEGMPVRMSSSGLGTQTSEVVALSKGGRATISVIVSTQTMKRTRKPSGSSDTTTSYTMEVCRAVPNGLYVDASIGIENGEDDSVDIGRTLLEIRLPCMPGTSWRVGRMTYKDGFTLRPQSEAVGYETVQVPAGTFENCLKVNSTCPRGIEGYMEQNGERLEIISGDLEMTSWYYPLIGLVKETSRSSIRMRPEGQEEAAILRMDTTTATELTEYRLGRR